MYLATNRFLFKLSYLRMCELSKMKETTISINIHTPTSNKCKSLITVLATELKIIYMEALMPVNTSITYALGPGQQDKD